MDYLIAIQLKVHRNHLKIHSTLNGNMADEDLSPLSPILPPKLHNAPLSQGNLTVRSNAVGKELPRQKNKSQDNKDY